jgi:clan AA aspartic protease (TIGR02281 family)
MSVAVPVLEAPGSETSVATLDIGDLERRVEDSMVVLRPIGEGGQPLSDVRGVLVDPLGFVLCRLQPLLGAHGGDGRLERPSGRRWDIAGVLQFDSAGDMALVKLDSGAEALPCLLVLDEPPGRAFIAGDVLFVLSGQKLRRAEVLVPDFAGEGGVSAVLLQADRARGPGAFLAVDSSGLVVGLCRDAPRGTAPREGPGSAGGEVSETLVEPAAPLVRIAQRGSLISLYQLSLRLYEGTFRAYMDKARAAFRAQRIPDARALIVQALARAQIEGVAREQAEDARRLLRDSFAAEAGRLRAENDLARATIVVEEALSHFPDDAGFWLLLAELRLGMGLLRDGISALDRLRSLEGGGRAEALLETAYLRLADELLRSGDGRQAELAYLEAAGALPRSALLQFSLAKLYFDWQAYDSAVPLFQEARRLDPALGAQVDAYLDRIDDAVKRREMVIITFPPGSSAIRANVDLDGRGEFPFIVDTGATYTAIPERLAVSLGYDPARGEPLVVNTAAGRLTVKRIQLVTVNLKGYVVRNLPVILLPESFGTETGLLGLNFLNFFKYEIDAKRGEFRLRRA